MSGPPTITVASYNMRKAIGTDRRRNPQRVLDVLREIDADIVALQEADKRFGAAATKLSAIRTKSAEKLNKAVNAELAPLKLERATFTTQIESAPNIKAEIKRDFGFEPDFENAKHQLEKGDGADEGRKAK